MSTIVDINVTPTVEEVTINTTEFLTTININTFTGTQITNTSQLVNDGEDGIHPYITLLDLPSNLILYPTNVASDIGGYSKIVTDIHDVDYNEPAVDISTGVITTTSQLVASLATAPNLINGNPGVFNITTIGNIKRISGSGEANFYFQVYKRTGAGVETLIGTSSNTEPVTLSTYIQFITTAIWDDGIFLDTDRIVLKFYANRIAGGSNPTYNFQFGGSTPVRTLVPIPLSVVPVNGVQTVTGTTVDNTDPLNPIVNVPTLQQVTTAGRTFAETDTATATDYSFGLFEGTGASKQFKAEVVNGGNTSFFRFSRSFFNFKAYFTSTSSTSLTTTLGQIWSSVENTFGISRITVRGKTAGSGTTDYQTSATRDAGIYTLDVEPIIKGSNFTADNTTNYTATATLTVTDPTPVTGKGFQVHVIGGTSTIGGVAYTAGALVYRYYDGAVWISTDMNKSQVADTITNGVTTIAPSQNAVFDALALKTDKARTIYQAQTSVTGVAVQTLLATMKITGGVYASTDAFMFNMAIQKGVTASTVEYKLWVGTSSGALTTQVGRVITNAVTRTADFIRPFFINSGLLDTSAGFNTNVITGESQGTAVNTPVSVTMTNDLWLSITVAPTNIADVVGIGFASIIPLK